MSTYLYSLSLHDALPISKDPDSARTGAGCGRNPSVGKTGVKTHRVAQQRRACRVSGVGALSHGGGEGSGFPQCTGSGSRNDIVYHPAPGTRRPWHVGTVVTTRA